MAGHAQIIARIVGGVAAILVIATALLGSRFSLLSIPFIVWGLLPYAALLILARFLPLPWLIGGAGVAALTVEAGVRANVFLFPRGSTAAIALVFSPILVTFAMCVGALAGWGFGYVFGRGGVVGRAVSVLAAVVIVGLVFIGLARPELFPTTVVTRQRHLAEIGEPRVVIGGDRFVQTPLSHASGWHLAGAFDERPGDDLAIVDHKGAQLIDAVSLRETQFIPFGGEPGRLWNWYSQLARVGDALVVVQTGGGFQDTQVMSLENELLWRYRPDAKLPPSVLRHGDLDGDGEIEFYASTTDAVTRLNTKGDVVWSRPSTNAHIVALAPRQETMPAWIVAMRPYAALDIWSADGNKAGEIKWPGTPAHDGVVEWPFDSAQGQPDARRLIVGDAGAVKGIDLAGRSHFEIPVDDPMQLVQAAAWTPAAAASRLLALVTGGDRDLARWRLRLYGAPDRVVYDQVFGAPPRLLVATNRDGSSTLFIIVDGTVSVMRPSGISSF